MNDQTRTLDSINAARNILRTSIDTLEARQMLVPQQARTILAHLETAAMGCALTRSTSPASIAVTITPNEKGNPPGKLADAEIHFLTGPLSGSKLIGFAIWERRTGGGRNVTFPARQYSVNGERRSFALLRPAGTMTGQDGTQEQIRDLILRAYASYDGPGMHTRTLYDDAGQLLTMDGGINLDRPTTDRPLTPEDSSAHRTIKEPSRDRDPGEGATRPNGDQLPSRQTSAGTLAQAAEAITQNPEINPGVILGSMIVQAVYGTPGPQPITPRARRF